MAYFEPDNATLQARVSPIAPSINATSTRATAKTNYMTDGMEEAEVALRYNVYPTARTVSKPLRMSNPDLYSVTAAGLDLDFGVDLRHVNPVDAALEELEDEDDDDDAVVNPIRPPRNPSIIVGPDLLVSHAVQQYLRNNADNASSSLATSVMTETGLRSAIGALIRSTVTTLCMDNLCSERVRHHILKNEDTIVTHEITAAHPLNDVHEVEFVRGMRHYHAVATNPAFQTVVRSHSPLKLSYTGEAFAQTHVDVSGAPPAASRLDRPPRAVPPRRSVASKLEANFADDDRAAWMLHADALPQASARTIRHVRGRRRSSISGEGNAASTPALHEHRLASARSMRRSVSSQNSALFAALQEDLDDAERLIGDSPPRSAHKPKTARPSSAAPAARAKHPQRLPVFAPEAHVYAMNDLASSAQVAHHSSPSKTMQLLQLLREVRQESIVTSRKQQLERALTVKEVANVAGAISPSDVAETEWTQDDAASALELLEGPGDDDACLYDMLSSILHSSNPSMDQLQEYLRARLALTGVTVEVQANKYVSNNNEIFGANSAQRDMIEAVIPSRIPHSHRPTSGRRVASSRSAPTPPEESKTPISAAVPHHLASTMAVAGDMMDKTSVQMPLAEPEPISAPADDRRNSATLLSVEKLFGAAAAARKAASLWHQLPKRFSLPTPEEKYMAGVKPSPKKSPKLASPHRNGGKPRMFPLASPSHRNTPMPLASPTATTRSVAHHHVPSSQGKTWNSRPVTSPSGHQTHSPTSPDSKYRSRRDISPVRSMGMHKPSARNVFDGLFADGEDDMDLFAEPALPPVVPQALGAKVLRQKLTLRSAKRKVRRASLKLTAAMTLMPQQES